MFYSLILNPSPHIPPLFPASPGTPPVIDSPVSPPQPVRPYLIQLRLAVVVMAAVHGVQRVVLMMGMLVVMKAALRAQGLRIGSRGRGAVRERRRC